MCNAKRAMFVSYKQIPEETTEIKNKGCTLK